MKKLIAFLICISLFLTGCGASMAETQPETTEATLTTVATEAPTESETEAPTETVAAEEGTIAETVVYDDGTFKLTAKEIDYSDDYDIEIKVLAENGSDKNVSFTGNYFSINGITMYCGFHVSVAPGKKANDSISLDRDDLGKYGIKSIATIAAQDAYIYNKDDSKTITNFKFSLETSIADGYVQDVDKSGQTVYEKDGVVIKYRGIDTDWTDDEVLVFYVENNTDVDFNVHAQDVSMNGFMVYGSMVARAYAGCVTYSELDFSSSDMEENDIDSIEEVSFTMYAYNDENGKLWTTGEITVGREPSESLSVQPEETSPVSATEPVETTVETSKPNASSKKMTDEQIEMCKAFLNRCQYSDLYEYISTLITDGDLLESEPITELLSQIETLANLSKKCTISVDAFEDETVVYYSGVTDISNSLNVVPCVTVDSWGISDLEYKLGFKKRGWLFFDKISVVSQNEKAQSETYASYDVNRDVISGGQIQEYVYSYLDIASFCDDENVTIQFKNSDTRETVDHALTNAEVSAVSTLSQINQIHSSVRALLAKK